MPRRGPSWADRRGSPSGGRRRQRVVARCALHAEGLERRVTGRPARRRGRTVVQPGAVSARVPAAPRRRSAGRGDRDLGRRIGPGRLPDSRGAALTLFPKFRVHRNARNVGAFHNEVLAVGLCREEWVVLLDSDDRLSRRYIDRLYALPAWSPDCALLSRARAAPLRLRATAWCRHRHGGREASPGAGIVRPDERFSRNREFLPSRTKLRPANGAACGVCGGRRRC